MSQVYWILFAQHGLKKLKILQRMYELISAFATQRFCSFWKTISSQILYTKSYKFHHVLNSTSSLAAWSPFISNMFPSVRKVLCKWDPPITLSRHINVFYAVFYPLGDRLPWSLHLAKVDPWGLSQFLKDRMKRRSLMMTTIGSSIHL